MVAKPHAVDNVVPVEQVEGTPIDQFVLGTCTNGRASDFELAASILRGKQVAPGARLLLLPASREILRQTMASGAMGALMEAGGMLLPAGCGPCLGAHLGVLAGGERCLSTSNRNFKGRMGCAGAEIFLASPATVAASAIHGGIRDPRKEIKGFCVCGTMEVRPTRGDCAMSRVWQYGDDVNTDMLFPGKYTYSCSKAEQILPHLLEDLDPSFAAGVRPGDVLLAGKNFGCGSSREQPALGLRAAGVEAVVAKSFARIFFRAAVNQGLLLVECPAAVDAYRQGDAVHLDPAAGTITVGEKTFSFPSLPEEILAIRRAGGLLPYARARLRQGRRLGSDRRVRETQP